jgi:hypothetical protein
MRPTGAAILDSRSPDETRWTEPSRETSSEGNGRAVRCGPAGCEAAGHGIEGLTITSGSEPLQEAAMPSAGVRLFLLECSKRVLHLAHELILFPVADV